MTFEIFQLAQNFHPEQSGIGFGGFGTGQLMLMGLVMLLSMGAAGMLRRRFAQYSQMPLRVTGAEVAQKMLRDNGIHDVRVISVPGRLTDHYNPADKTVNLSEGVYAMNNVAAAAVAAHEVGHAVQHQQAYHWLTFRSKMVPAVQISSQLVTWLIMGGLIMAGATQSATLLWAGVALFAVTTLFSIITLPVEFDASRRALVWLERSGLAASMEHEKAKNALFWAAMTYVVGAVGSVATLAYYIMLAMSAGRRSSQ